MLCIDQERFGQRLSITDLAISGRLREFRFANFVFQLATILAQFLS